MPKLTVPFSDRVYCLQGSPQDLSVAGGLTATSGVWEPHLMSVMEKHIGEDAICFDIGLISEFLPWS